MPDITLANASRPKLTQTVPLTVGLVNKTPDINDTDDTITYRLGLADYQPPAFTASGTLTDTEVVVTGSSNAFLNVRPGDAVSGTGIPASTTVASKESNISITLSQAATQSGSQTLTFTPPEFDATLVQIRLSGSTSGSSLNLSGTIRTYDGSSAFDSNNNGSDGVSFADASSIQTNTFSLNLNLDSFLSNARTPRTND